MGSSEKKEGGGPGEHAGTRAHAIVCTWHARGRCVLGHGMTPKRGVYQKKHNARTRECLRLGINVEFGFPGHELHHRDERARKRHHADDHRQEGHDELNGRVDPAQLLSVVHAIPGRGGAKKQRSEEEVEEKRKKQRSSGKERRIGQ